MEIVIRIVLMFLFIQFLVVTTIMSVALLLARPEVPAWGIDGGQQSLRRSLTTVFHLPGRCFRCGIRWARSLHIGIAH